MDRVGWGGLHVKEDEAELGAGRKHEEDNADWR
jgi:hypothetical protein